MRPRAFECRPGSDARCPGTGPAALAPMSPNRRARRVPRRAARVGSNAPNDSSAAFRANPARGAGGRLADCGSRRWKRGSQSHRDSGEPRPARPRAPSSPPRRPHRSQPLVDDRVLPTESDRRERRAALILSRVGFRSLMAMITAGVDDWLSPLSNTARITVTMLSAPRSSRRWLPASLRPAPPSKTARLQEGRRRVKGVSCSVSPSVQHVRVDARCRCS